MRRLSISKGTLANWVISALSSAAPAAPGKRSFVDAERENARLRRELMEARMERDILKKATVLFAKGSAHGMR